MKRYDLRGLKTDFLQRLVEIVDTEIADGENAIFLFEIGDFTAIQSSADCIKDNNWTLMNSLKFNEVDWTVVIKKAPSKKIVEEDVKEEAQ
jgi:NADH-quinone oxidoreductase subunit E